MFFDLANNHILVDPLGALNQQSNQPVQRRGTPISVVGGLDHGGHFIEYVDRTRAEGFPFEDRRPTVVTHTNLWPHRTLRLKMHREATIWRTAEVESFAESLSGEHFTQFGEECSSWNLTLRFIDVDERREDFSIGDIVSIHGLKGAQQHNDQTGSVVEFNADQGRYGVKYRRNGALQFPGLRSQNIRHVETFTFELHRCHPVGGGILKPSEYQRRACALENDLFISFEWLDPPSPQVDLSQDLWYVSCPICRAETTCDDLLEHAHLLPTATDQECPVCMETPEECQSLVLPPLHLRKMCSHVAKAGRWYSILQGGRREHQGFIDGR